MTSSSGQTLYLTTLTCPSEEGHRTTIAHEGGTIPLDQETPWPDVECCPVCGTDYPPDLAEVIAEVGEAVRVRPEAERDD